MVYILTVSFALGLFFEKIFELGIKTSILGSVIILIITLIIFREKINLIKIILLIGIAFIFGILRIALIDQTPDPLLNQSIDQKILIEGRVVKEPDERDDSIRYTIKPENSESRVMVVTGRLPRFDYYDKLSVSGVLKLPKNFTNDQGVSFDYLSYLAKDKIHFIVYQPEIKILDGKNFNFVGNLYKLKYFLTGKINAVTPEPNASLINGLLFGTKQSLGTDLLDDFKNVGLIHIIVLSGYNITIIAVGIFYFTSFFGKRNLGFVIASIGIILFVLMVGLSATVIRASIMALIGILARFLGRPADALRWLFIAGFLMLTYNPLILTDDPSFQLSFMATLGLIIFSPFVYYFISKKLPWIPIRFGIREIVASTLAVQIFILPLLIKMSGSVSLISFLINPLVLPVIPILMGVGAITGGLGAMSQILSWPFGILGFLITEAVIRLVEFSAALPLATIQIKTLPIWVMVIWYAIYAFIFGRLRNSAPPPPNSN